MRTIACLATLALVAAACNPVTRVNTVEPADLKAVPKDVAIRKVNYDSALGEAAKVTAAYEGHTPAGALRVQLQVANLTSGTECDFMWKCEWFDSAGLSISGQNPQWTKVILLPGQDTTINAVAASPAAVDWRISMTKWQRK